MRRWFDKALVFLAAAALSTVSHPYAQIMPPGGSRIISLTGTLSVRHAGRNRLLRINDPVAIGDELTTGDNSEAVIHTMDGATVRIFPDTRIIFSGQTAGLADFLRLLLGSIKVHVEKLSGRPNPHKMTTPTAVIAVRGTTFSVFVDENEATLVAVDEGIVSVANIHSPGNEVLLRRGERTWVGGNQLPLPAQAFRGNSERADLIPGRGRDRGMREADGPQAKGQAKGLARGQADGIGASNPSSRAPGRLKRAGSSH